MYAITSAARRILRILATSSVDWPHPVIGESFMRILYCNQYNFPFSGTEAYLFEVIELMRSKGHEVALFAMADSRGKPTPYDQHFVPYMNFKNRPGWFDRARLAGHAIYSLEARRRIRRMIAEFRPDVAHVRNIYHHLSPSILWELKSQGVPLLYHINDFKMICPSYNMVSQGRPCERCQGGRFRGGVASGCGGISAQVVWNLSEVCGLLSCAQPVRKRQVDREWLGFRA